MKRILYMPIGRPTNATDSVSLMHDWSYNNRSELAAASIGTNLYGYSYDTIGNRLWSAANLATNTYVANALNQYTSVGRGVLDPPQTSALVYDADGNMTRDDRFLYSYYAENRLRSIISSVVTNGALHVLNAYDHRNRRIRKTIQRLSVSVAQPPSPPVEVREWQTLETHTFVWDGNNIVLEKVDFADGTTRTFEYFWGLDKSGTEQGAGGVEGLLAVSMDGVFYIPCYDHNGNIVFYTSEIGALAAQYTYDPYGNIIESSSPLADVFSFGFSTQYHDRETDVIGYQQRVYQPVFGRWFNRDPIEEEGGENLYAFCGNNPILYVDVNGEFFLLDTLVAAAIGGVIGGVSAALTGGDIAAGAVGGFISGAYISICPAAAAHCGAAGGAVAGLISGVRGANKAKLCGAKWHSHVAGSIAIGTVLGRYSGKLSSQLSDGLSQAAGGILTSTTTRTSSFSVSLSVVGPDIATSISCGVTSTAAETVFLTTPEAAKKAIDEMGNGYNKAIEKVEMEFEASGQFK